MKDCKWYRVCNNVYIWAACLVECVSVFMILPVAAGEPNVKQTKGASLDYPKRVMIPSDIPAIYRTREVPGKTVSELVFPVAIYSVSHFRGWQKFLKHFGEDGRDIDDCKWKQASLPTFEPFSTRGDEDGYNACRGHLEMLLGTHSTLELRKMARRSYVRPPSDPPPPQSKP